MEAITESKTFPKFPDLPGELQLRIWDHFTALNIRPQLFTFYTKSPDTYQESQLGMKYNVRDKAYKEFSPRARQPYDVFWRAALQTSKDLKKEALKDCTICFAERMEKPIYFDPQFDVLFFQEPETLSNFQNRTRDKQGPALQRYGIKTLATEFNYPIFEHERGIGRLQVNADRVEFRKLYQTIRSFRSLEVLYIVSAKDTNVDAGDVTKAVEVFHKKYTCHCGMSLAQGTKVDRYNLPKIEVVTVEELWQKLDLTQAKGFL